MSKMGQEFEKNLDNAKYDLYKALNRIVESYRHAGPLRNTLPFLEAIEALNKAEGVVTNNDNIFDVEGGDK